MLEVSEEPFRVLSAGGQLTLGSLGVLSDMWGGREKGGKKGREMKGESLSGTGAGGGNRSHSRTRPGGLQNFSSPLSLHDSEDAGSN